LCTISKNDVISLVRKHYCTLGLGLGLGLAEMRFQNEMRFRASIGDPLGLTIT